MNQNVFGVILFSFIVGLSVLVSAYLVPLPTPPPVYERPVTVKNTHSCASQSRTVINQTTPAGLATVKITQAVLNQRTNQLNTEFSVKRENQPTKEVGVALHFFVKNGRTTQYLATETIIVRPDFEADDAANHDILSSFQWLDDLNRRDNLYVMPELSQNFRLNKSLEPKFESAHATPVLLMKGN